MRDRVERIGKENGEEGRFEVTTSILELGLFSVAFPFVNRE